MTYTYVGLVWVAMAVVLLAVGVEWVPLGFAVIGLFFVLADRRRLRRERR